MKKKCGHIIGIDEAGRGPLAGPLVVGGIRIESRIKNYESRFFGGIRDSKKLSSQKREEWFKKLTANPRIEWAYAVISPRVIDKINILQSARRGAYRVYKKLAGNCPCKAMLDGSLRLPASIQHKVFIKGDERFPIISAASIIAKVMRDRMMTRLHKKYPAYGFDIHKGYGTPMHYARIKKSGISEIHRKTFRLI
ncbi:MAG: ribonuclease HII [Patescibacteria group bacterium]